MTFIMALVVGLNLRQLTFTHAHAHTHAYARTYAHTHTNLFDDNICCMYAYKNTMYH